MHWRFEPLTSWPWTRTDRRRSGGHFSANWPTTVEELTFETTALGAAGPVVIRVPVASHDIAPGGRQLYREPRWDELAIGDGVGVAISFTGRHGPLTYPCDTYMSWQVNVRAVVLSLRALRAVERYGVGGRGEQYAGWQAIESAPTRLDTVDEAIGWLVTYVGAEPGSDARILLRRAARKAHPDVGGDPADWNRVDQVRQLIEREGDGSGR